MSVIAAAAPIPLARPRESTVAAPAQRNIAVDAYRGFVMLLMMAEVMKDRKSVV